MTTVCIGCGLQTDETGRLYVQQARDPAQLAFPALCDDSAQALLCDPDAGMYVVEHFASCDYTEQHAISIANYLASNGPSQLIDPGAFISLSSCPGCRCAYTQWSVTLAIDMTVAAETDIDVVMEISCGTDPAGTFPNTLWGTFKGVGGTSNAGRHTFQGTAVLNQSFAGPVGPVSKPQAPNSDCLVLSMRPAFRFRSTTGSVITNGYEMNLCQLQVEDALDSRATGGATVP